MAPVNQLLTDLARVRMLYHKIGWTGGKIMLELRTLVLLRAQLHAVAHFNTRIRILHGVPVGECTVMPGAVVFNKQHITRIDSGGRADHNFCFGPAKF